MIFLTRIENQGLRIRKNLLKSHKYVNLQGEIPMLTAIITLEKCRMEYIEWGITNKAIFQALAEDTW